MMDKFFKDIYVFFVNNDMSYEQIIENFEVKENRNFISIDEFVRKAKKLFIGRSIDKIFDNQKIKEFTTAFTYN